MAPTLTPARQTFRETVANVAARAKAALPTQVNGRVESAVRLVLAHDVELHDDGSAQVGSASDPLKTYTVAGQACDCQDYAYGKAPDGWCQHRIAVAIQQRVQEQLAAQLPAPIQVPDEVELGYPDNDPEETTVPVPPTPQSLFEAPACVNVRLTIGGRDVQWTLRDSDEARLALRLEALLARYPAPQPPQAPAQAQPVDTTPQCPQHGAMKPSTKGTGFYCAHKRDDGTWCPQKGK